METKKNEKFKLEQFRKQFLLFGLALSLSFVWMAMEYKSYGKRLDQMAYVGVEPDEVELPPIVMQKKPIKQPTPPKKKEVLKKATPSDLFKPVDNNVAVSNDSVFVDPDDFVVPDDGLREGIMEVPEPIEISKNALTMQPVFPGCEDIEDPRERNECTEAAINHFIATHFEYPDVLREYEGMSGKIFVQFMVDENGFITNVEVLKGKHKLLDQAGLKAVESLPRMTPGQKDDKKVRAIYQVPINIKRG